MPRAPHELFKRRPFVERTVRDDAVGLIAGLVGFSAAYLLSDDGELKLSLNTSRLKTRNLQRRPACSLFLLDLENPYKYVDVRGRARLEPDDDYAFADKVGAKYGGADLRDHDVLGDSRVIVT